jgi:predicted nuclease of predicted toxin-antitoxin system
MKIKLDENLSNDHTALLRQHGHDADRVHDQGMSGASDDAVWARVCAEGRFLITLDLDFSDIRRFPAGSHPGILLQRPLRQSVAGVLSILTRLLASEEGLESFARCLAVADDYSTRVRRPDGPSTIDEARAPQEPTDEI